MKPKNLYAYLCVAAVAYLAVRMLDHQLSSASVIVAVSVLLLTWLLLIALPKTKPS
jgi:hypothetical protein